MSDAKKPRCETCRYVEFEDGEVARCRRRAPSPQVAQWGQPVYIDWPEVTPRDWCGEHES